MRRARDPLGADGCGFWLGRSRGITPKQSPVFGVLILNLLLTFGLSSFISVGGHIGGPLPVPRGRRSSSSRPASGRTQPATLANGQELTAAATRRLRWLARVWGRAVRSVHYCRTQLPSSERLAPLPTVDPVAQPGQVARQTARAPARARPRRPPIHHRNPQGSFQAKRVAARPGGAPAAALKRPSPHAARCWRTPMARAPPEVFHGPRGGTGRWRGCRTRRRAATFTPPRSEADRLAAAAITARWRSMWRSSSTRGPWL